MSLTLQGALSLLHSRVLKPRGQDTETVILRVSRMLGYFIFREHRDLENDLQCT